MQTLILYVSTAVIFLGLDAIALKFMMKPLFERHLGDLILASPRLGPAAVFYLFYVAGILYFVSVPAMAAGTPYKALITGAFLGAMAYGTYEFTNFATLKPWAWQMVVTDCLWGTLLTGVAACGGILITRWFA